MVNFEVYKLSLWNDNSIEYLEKLFYEDVTSATRDTFIDQMNALLQNSWDHKVAEDLSFVLEGACMRCSEERDFESMEPYYKKSQSLFWWKMYPRTL